MVAHKALKVKAKPGVLCPAMPLGPMIKYIGREYDPKADPMDLEAEFKAIGEVLIPSTPYHRRLVANGDLIACDEDSAAQCGLKFPKKDKA